MKLKPGEKLHFRLVYKLGIHGKVFYKNYEGVFVLSTVSKDDFLKFPVWS